MSEGKHVYTAIAAVAADVAAVGISKDRKNQQQGYAFRGIDDVYNTLAPLLAKHKLVILPRVIDRTVTERQTKTGGALFYTVLTVEFDFVSAVDGSIHTVRTIGEAMDSADKSGSKAQSTAYKYAAFMTFSIPTEGDSDTENHSHDVAPNASAKPVAPAKPVNGVKPPERKLAATPPDDRKLTHEERKHLVSVITALKLPMVEAQTLLANLGFHSTADIPVSRLQSIVDALTKAAKAKWPDGKDPWDDFGKDGGDEPGDPVQ